MAILIILGVVLFFWLGMPYIARWIQRWLARQLVKRVQNQMGDAFGQMFGDAFDTGRQESAKSNKRKRQSHNPFSAFREQQARDERHARGVRARSFMRSVSEIITFVEIPYVPYRYTSVTYTVEQQIADADWKEIKG